LAGVSLTARRGIEVVEVLIPVYGIIWIDCKKLASLPAGGPPQNFLRLSRGFTFVSRCGHVPFWDCNRIVFQYLSNFVPWPMPPVRVQQVEKMSDVCARGKQKPRSTPGLQGGNLHKPLDSSFLRHITLSVSARPVFHLSA
jgi:hypothetical protein